MYKKPKHNAVLASFVGFLFGFDTVVISGSNLPIKELWNTSEWFHGFFIMSVALWGTLIGSAFGNIPCDRIGRKNTLFWIAVVYFISAIGTALATDPYFFSAYRFLGGIAIGASTVAAPTYISEISPYKWRGKLVGLFQLNIVVGILAAFLSNYLLVGVGGDLDWRLMMGAEAIPAILFLILVVDLPESPRWLISKRINDKKGIEIIHRLFGTNQHDTETLISQLEDEKKQAGKGTFDFKKLKKSYFLAFLIAFFNQVCGINFILIYGPEILQLSGLETAQSLLLPVFIGLANLIFTIVSLKFIDRVGRRKLMIFGSIGYLISLSLLVLSSTGTTISIIGYGGFILFIVSHAIGQGSVIWVFIAEIFPNMQRAKGQSFGSFVHWTLAALITFLGTVIIGSFELVYIFSCFLVFAILQLFFVLFLMPETTKLTLEELQIKIHTKISQPIQTPSARVFPAD
ncbi:sugar porter family MFS transporter [Fontibacter flavus]|uniref:Sugar porter family MFS transporter n=1 Tax=Fontibacter flavus TaxID=654838 RepID=A0ABV6FPU6_9BACT